MILERTRLVTKNNGPRPAGAPDQCFYCLRMLGEPHESQCVLYQRTVKVRAVIEYEVRVPATWTREHFEWDRNGRGNWGAVHFAGELNALTERDEEGCTVRFEYLGEGTTDAAWDAPDAEEAQP
jgi:hypothetical protein